MAWDVAKSLDVLLGQINAMAPRRSKASDGSIGDTAHQAQGSASEHNPEDKPYPEADEVDARDFTHDPGAGADMDVISEQLRLSRDRRTKYVIWRQRIFSSYAVAGIPAWTWRRYSGAYHSHMHVSVNDVADDDTTPWAIGPPRQEVTMFLAQVTGQPTVYLSTGIKYRPVPDYGTFLLLRDTVGLRHLVVGSASALAALCGEPEYPGPDPVTLAPEQLAQVGAAAREGASAGSGGASVDEIRAVVDQELDEAFGGGADNDGPVAG